MDSEPIINTGPLMNRGASPVTLLAFTQAISMHINSNPALQRRWVVAEIADFRLHGRHAYGQLIEKDNTGRTVARINATIWDSNLGKINNKFREATGRRIATGMKLLLELSASHSPAYGLSANITDIDPAYTLGDMERLRREIIERLQKEGIFDCNHSLPLSPAPQKIAVISAEGAAGYGDFMNQINSSGFAFHTLLYPASMQGDRTVGSVLGALDLIEMAVDFWDCVVIIRGGGATSDLNAFDNYELARRVATYPIPIIVGIGHERDNTVLDYIAHTRCKTPTAVAAFLIERLSQAEATAEELMRRVAERTRSVLGIESQRLAHLAAMVPVLAPGRIAQEKHRLSVISTMLQRGATAKVNRANARLGEITSTLARSATAIITAQKARISAIPEVLRRSAAQRVLLERRRLDSDARMIDVLNPASTLKRGYSITRVNGQAVRSAALLSPGTEIVTTLADGTTTSVVISTEPKN